MSSTSNWKLYTIASMILSAVLFCGVLFLYSMTFQLDNKVWGLEKQLEEAGNSSHSTIEEKADIQKTLDELVANGGDLFSTIQLESSPKNNFVVQGERFETELFLSSSIPLGQEENIMFSVNGKSLPVKDGKAKLIVTAPRSGTMSYDVSANITNPSTGEKQLLRRSFEYEVGQRAVNVFPSKMNVLYIGVDNPVSVTAMGINSNELKVSCEACSIRKNGGKGNYSVTVSKPGEAKITVSGGELPPSVFSFRAKRIPDPVAKIGKSSGGVMGSGEFKTQAGVGAFLEHFDFEARCQIQGYKLGYLTKKADRLESVNGGARYNENSKKLIKQAKPGDIFYFDNVKAKCPGDKAGRKINSMIFMIR